MSAPVKTIRLYNRSESTIIHDKHVAHPGSFVEVPEEIALKWLDMFPTRFKGAEEVLKAGEGTKAAIAEKDKRIAELEAKIAELSKKSSPKGGKKEDNAVV